MAVTGFICQSMDHLFHIWSSPTHKHHIFYCRGRTVACIIASKSYLSEHPISEISKRYMLKLGRFFPAPFNIMPGLFIHNCLNIDFKPSNDFHLKIHYFMNKSLCLWFYPDYSQNTQFIESTFKIYRIRNLGAAKFEFNKKKKTKEEKTVLELQASNSKLIFSPFLTTVFLNILPRTVSRIISNCFQIIFQTVCQLLFFNCYQVFFQTLIQTSFSCPAMEEKASSQ